MNKNRSRRRRSQFPPIDDRYKRVQIPVEPIVKNIRYEQDTLLDSNPTEIDKIPNTELQKFNVEITYWNGYKISGVWDSAISNNAIKLNTTTVLDKYHTDMIIPLYDISSIVFKDKQSRGIVIGGKRNTRNHRKTNRKTKKNVNA